MGKNSNTKIANSIKNGLNWDEFYEQQKKSLENINESFSKSLKSSESIEKSMRSLAENFDIILGKSTDKFNSQINESTTQLKSLSLSTIFASDKIKRTAEENEMYLKKMRERTKEEDEENAKKMRAEIKQRTKDLFTYLSKQANELSKNINAYMKGTGSDYLVSKEVRKEITQSIVSQLNSDTGYFFNAQEAYQNMIALASSSGIGDPEAIKELTRPLLLAGETTNMNLSNLTSMFGKWSTRYNMTSREMEGMVDEIRGNTAGNNSTAESVQNALDTLQDDIALMTGGDSASMAEYSKSISEIVAYMESTGASNEDLNYLISAVQKFADGSYVDDTGLFALTKGFSGVSDPTAWAKDPNNVKELVLAIAQGTTDLYNNLSGEAASRVLHTLGQDYRIAKSLAADARGVGNEDIYSLSKLNEFLMNQDKQNTAAEEVKDMYVSHADKISNGVSRIYTILANLQETWLPSISDSITAISIALSTYNTLMFLRGGEGSVGSSLGSKLFPKLGSKALSGVKAIGAGAKAASTSIGTTAGLSGTAAIAGGAALGAAGVAGGVYGLVDAYQDAKEGKYGSATVSGTAGAAMLGGTAAAAGLLGTAATGVGIPIALAGASMLAIKKIADEVNGLGNIENSIKEDYENVMNNTLSRAKDSEKYLIDIKKSISLGKDLTSDYQKLVDTGLLSEKDKQEALKAAKDGNISALEELTQSYIDANKEWSQDYTQYMNGVKKENMKVGAETKEALNTLLQEWNDEGATDEEMKIAESLLFSLYQDLASQDISKMDKYTKGTYEVMRDVLSDGELSTKDFDDIMDNGMFNQYFKKTNFNTDALLESILYTGDSSDIAKELLGNVYKYATEYKSGQDAHDEYMESHSSHDTGTNYVDKNHLALVHEGEAIIPSQFNPLTHYGAVADILENRKSKDSESISELVSILKDIRSFLEYWKSDSSMQSKIDRARNRNSTTNDALVNYQLY